MRLSEWSGLKSVFILRRVPEPLDDELVLLPPNAINKVSVNKPEGIVYGITCSTV